MIGASGDNLQIVLASRPVASPSEAHFQLRRARIPEPGPGQILIKHLYVGLSPSARLRMSGDSDYGKGLVLGDVVIGQTVGVVAHSRNSEFREGELVVTSGGKGWPRMNQIRPSALAYQRLPVP